MSEPLTLCVNSGNHGSTGTGADRKPCLECAFGREIGKFLELFRAERKTLETAQAETGDDEWRGHFFPEPEELGADPESVDWTHGNCACGTTYRDYELYGEACPS